MPKERAELLKQRLQTLKPESLEIIDESHLHVGHEGAKDGASHFRLVITSSAFNGLRPLARHRLVYDLVDDLIPYPIHALAITANPSS